jgi:hypothetical protein
MPVRKIGFGAQLSSQAFSSDHDINAGPQILGFLPQI